MTIDTTEDYDRLSLAAYRGDEFALGYIHYLNSKHQVPSAVRSPGVTRLVKHYSPRAHSRLPWNDTRRGLLVIGGSNNAASRHT